MKSFLYSLILIFFFCFAKAETFSELNLRLYDGGPITVMIDNQYISSASNNIVLKNLLPGRHYMQVLRSTTSLITQNSAGSLSYPSYLFNGIVAIPYNVALFAYVDAFSGLNVTEVLPLARGNINVAFNSYALGHPALLKKYNMQDTLSYLKFKKLVPELPSSEYKLLLVKKAVTFNTLYSWQVAELMRLLDFDTERLEFAKYAYYFTKDQGNIDVIDEAFIFRGTALEFNRQTFQYF